MWFLDDQQVLTLRNNNWEKDELNAFLERIEYCGKIITVAYIHHTPILHTSKKKVRTRMRGHKVRFYGDKSSTDICGILSSIMLVPLFLL